MINNHPTASRNPFDVTGPSTQEQRSSAGDQSSLPEGWLRLPTGLRGARLYRVRLPFDFGFYWEAGVMLNGRVVHRSFVSERHARAWLSMVIEPPSAPGTLNLEGLNGSLRTAGMARNG